jgi:hypothetical protein
MAVQIGLSALMLGATFTGAGRMRRSTDVMPEDAAPETTGAARENRRIR